MLTATAVSLGAIGYSVSGGAALFRSHLQQQSSRRSPTEPLSLCHSSAPYGDAQLRLLPSERAPSTLKAAPLVTVTTLDGPCPLDFLSKRVVQIVQQNPWLTSRLFEVDGEARLCYMSQPSFSDADRYLHSLDIHAESDVSITAAETETHAARHVHMLASRGEDSLNRIERVLFSVVTLRLAPRKFVLLFSMSRMLGDGHTFSRLYQMLDSHNKVIPLIAQRHPTFEAHLCAHIGPDQFYYETSPATVFGQRMHHILQNLSDPPQRKRYVVDMKAVIRAKQHALMSPGKCDTWVSTHDILCSLFITQTQATCGVVIMNSRGARLPELHLPDALAGNYSGLRVLSRAQASTPQAVRHAMQNLSESAVPSRCVRLTQGHSALFLNYMAYSHELKLPSCVTTSYAPYHTPVSMKDMIASYSSIGLLYYLTPQLLILDCLVNTASHQQLQTSELITPCIGIPLAMCA